MLAAGTIVAGHVVLSRLGRGGQGEVYRARDPGGREVALKLLTAGAPGGEAFGRFRREMRLLCSLDHPRVVRAYATGEDAGRPWIACELAPDGTLADALQARGPLGQAATIELLSDLIEGLIVLADAGIAHRDVKPSNILAFAGRWKLGDLGMARRYEPDGSSWTGSGHVVGTPAYIAPELVAGEAANFASDVYAAGCVAYQCLVGEQPYTGADAMAVLRQHLNAPVADPGIVLPDLDPALRLLVCELMDKRLDRRPTDPALLLQRVAGVRALVSGRNGPGYRTTRRISVPSSTIDIAPSTTMALDAAQAAEAGGLAHVRLAIPGGPRLHAWAGAAITLGRDRAGLVGWHIRTVLLPETGHAPDNKRISGHHLSLAFADGRCLVEDLGSSWGTRMSGQRLRPRVPVEVADGAELDLAGVLSLRLRLLAGGAVLVRRLGNAPDLGYLLVAGAAGLAADLAGPGAAIELANRDGGLVLGGRGLRDGDRIALPGAPVHVHDLLADDEY